MRKFTKRNIIYVLKLISFLYLLILVINTWFFYGKYLYQTIFGTGLFGAGASFILTYDVDFRKLTNEQRVLTMAAGLLVLLLILYKIYKFFKQ